MTPLFRRSTASDAAFERLYRRHVTDVYRYSLAVLGEPADAEDVTQTTFMNAYRAMQRGEQPKKPENWLISIAHNVCRQRFRQAGRRPNEVEFNDAIGGAEAESEGPTADDLRRAFSELPPNQREALVMRELEGRSYAEIAGVLGISTSALETLIFRARRALREQLEERLTCDEAAFSISKEADGRLTTEERRSLRAHLRACRACSTAAQRQRALRRALKTMIAVPLPQSLASFFGGSAGVGAATAAGAGAAGVALKAASVLTAGVLVGGGTYAGVKKLPALGENRTTTAALPRAAAVVPAASSREAPAVDASRQSASKQDLNDRALGKAKQPDRAKPGKQAGKKVHAKPVNAKDAKARVKAKPAGGKPVDAKPADGKPADAKPADGKPAKVKPAVEKREPGNGKQAEPTVKRPDLGARALGGRVQPAVEKTKEQRSPAR